MIFLRGGMGPSHIVSFSCARRARLQNCLQIAVLSGIILPVCSLFLAKTNEKDACFRVPPSSSLPQSCAKEKSSGVEMDLYLLLINNYSSSPNGL